MLVGNIEEVRSKYNLSCEGNEEEIKTLCHSVFYF